MVERSVLAIISLLQEGDLPPRSASQDCIQCNLVSSLTPAAIPDAWIESLHAEAAKPTTIVDGIRIRDIKVAVGSQETTAILTRAEAEDRGAPYRDLTAQRNPT
ncbi:hypothetical protein [Brevundimonas sp.]|uniref:hypothetical protein n=1 Tax=Brevundimonas sp. TaxID=1871086 RepID=UPI001AC667A9|nr:hypothetical protein [Brevundimonas sp.]MBN9467031.1 hypothetical protein [Brevundimonas sp.]